MRFLTVAGASCPEPCHIADNSACSQPWIFAHASAVLMSQAGETKLCWPTASSATITSLENIAISIGHLANLPQAVLEGGATMLAVLMHVFADPQLGCQIHVHVAHGAYALTQIAC